ncbi:S-adenosyl-L-methionine-dependent methyltransferase [Dentipellis sp. KUC8613]|nr:S-adenosyl-L-methionine-dependent methyltransferase [Dentipellis sp. KUC8613]
MTDVLPQSNEEYGTKEYWDKRYAQEAGDASFDWFKKYEDVADLIREAVPDKAARILMLGCGNSTLSEDMYDDGYKNIVNIDYSPVVVEQMRNRHQNSRPEMSWHEMDIRALTFGDSTFDVAIDKGTMDAMMTAKGDVWDPPQQVIDDCTKEVDEVLRVLRKGTGVFLYLTFGQPHFRRRFLTRDGTSLEIKRIGEAFHYYFYIVRT